MLVAEPAGKQELQLKSSFFPSFLFPSLFYAHFSKENGMILSDLATERFSLF